LWSSAAFLALIVCFLLVEHVRGKIAYRRHVKELTRNGEQLSIAAMEPKRPSPDQNAAPLLSPLTNAIETSAATWQNPPPALRFPEPGKALVTWRLKEWSRDGKRTNNWERVGAQLLQARDILTAIHSAAAQPAFDGGVDYQKGFVDFRTGPVLAIKRAAQTLFVAADYELNRDHFDDAYADVLDLVKLTASQKSEPLVISQLVRLAGVAMAFQATWKLLQAPGGTPAQFAALQQAWEKADFAADMAAAFEMERAMTLDYFEQILASNSKLRFVVSNQEAYEEPFNWFVTSGFLLHWVNVPLWRIAWAQQDQLHALQRWQKLIERDRLARTNSWAAVSSQLIQSRLVEMSLSTDSIPDQDRPSSWERFRFLFSAGPLGVSDQTIRSSLTAEAQQQMAITAIALRRFQMQTGKLPGALNALVPEYLQKLPRDPMDGGVLHYRPSSELQFVLYSVGTDAKDDGGDSALNSETKHYRQIWDGRDAVWPNPATPTNSVQAMQWTKD